MYCPDCPEKILMGLWNGYVYCYCVECGYISKPLTQARRTATVMGGRRSPRTPVRGGNAVVGVRG